MKKIILTLLLSVMSFSMLSAEEEKTLESTKKTNKHNLSFYLGNDSSTVSFSQNGRDKVDLEKSSSLGLEFSYMYSLLDRLRLGLSLKTTGENSQYRYTGTSVVTINDDAIEADEDTQVKANVLAILSLGSEYDFLKFHNSRFFVFGDVGYGLYMLDDKTIMSLGSSTLYHFNLGYKKPALSYSLGLGYYYDLTSHIKLATKVSYNKILDAKMLGNQANGETTFHNTGDKKPDFNLSSQGNMRYMFGLTYAF